MMLKAAVGDNDSLLEEVVRDDYRLLKESSRDRSQIDHDSDDDGFSGNHAEEEELNKMLKKLILLKVKKKNSNLDCQDLLKKD